MDEQGLAELEAQATRWREIVGEAPVRAWEDPYHGGWYVYAPDRCTILAAGLDVDAEDKAACEAVAVAVNAMPALIDEVRRLRERLLSRGYSPHDKFSDE